MEHETFRELAAGYALAALDPESEREFEDHLGRCEACREELASFQETAALLAYEPEMPGPPAALRERILASAAEERPKVVPLRRSRPFRLATGLAAVAAAAAIGIGIWAASLSSSLDAEREAADAQARTLAVLAQPGAERIPVSGAPGTLLVSPSGEAALVLERLDKAPDEKTYEAWVIEDGEPKPAGLFDGGEPAVVLLSRPVPAGAIVAVTIEDEEGADAPTGKPLFTAATA